MVRLPVSEHAQARVLGSTNETISETHMYGVTVDARRVQVFLSRLGEIPLRFGFDTTAWSLPTLYSITKPDVRVPYDPVLYF